MASLGTITIDAEQLKDAVEVFSLAVETLAEIEGMKAENAVRADKWLAPAYDEEAFAKAGEGLCNLRISVLLPDSLDRASANHESTSGKGE